MVSVFGDVFLLGAGYTLLHNEHVRIDVISARLSPRTRAAFDIVGTLFFLLPMALIILKLSWPLFVDSFSAGEVSSNAGGLIRWPAKLLIPVGFLLLVLQGISELIKRVGLSGRPRARSARRAPAHGRSEPARADGRHPPAR